MFIKGMTKAQAIIIKDWRMGNPMHSWRRIAQKCAEEFGVEDCMVDHGDHVDGCQFSGREICLTAAQKLGDLNEDGDLTWD